MRPTTRLAVLLVLAATTVVASTSIAHAAPCAVTAGDHYDVDSAGRFVLRRLTELKPDGCSWQAPRGIVLNGYQLSYAGQQPAVIRTDPGVSALVVTNKRKTSNDQQYLIRNLRIESPNGRGIEFALADPNGASGSLITGVQFVGSGVGIWGLPSGVQVTQCEFDSTIGILAPGGGQVFHPTIDNNVFRNTIWGVFVADRWQRTPRRETWPSPETRTELTVRGNHFECRPNVPLSTGIILLHVNEAGIEENTIRGCSFGVLMDTTHRVLIQQNTIDDLGTERTLTSTTRGVLDRYSAGWAVYHNDIHAMWGVQSVQKGGLDLMQDAVWWNRITAMQGYRVHVENLVAYPVDDESSFPDKEWGGNNHYPYTGQPTAEAGDEFYPLVVTGGAQSPYPGFPYPYPHDPNVQNTDCDRRRWTWVNPGAVNGAPDDVKGNFAQSYGSGTDNDGDGIADQPVSFPGHATLACTIGPGSTFRQGPFWWDRCFRTTEFVGAGRGRTSPGPNVTPCL